MKAIRRNADLILLYTVITAVFALAIAFMFRMDSELAKAAERKATQAAERAAQVAEEERQVAEFVAILKSGVEGAQ